VRGLFRRVFGDSAYGFEPTAALTAGVAHRENVGLLAYSPLAQGYLTGKYAEGALP
jgi:aryl-alcohol dehydrogenase-like predicted oxidoreductase